ncbi:MAG: flagellar biosynthetic protein FliP, partial [Firmicutes bacterium HGW-Firmicutes-13]
MKAHRSGKIKECFKKSFLVLLIITTLLLLSSSGILAQPLIPMPNLNIEVGTAEEPQEVVGTIQLLILLSLLAVVPAVILLMTSFTRIVIVLAFIRSALATQQTPPNQVIIGLALFLTFFIMAPVYRQVNLEAVQPYLEGEITQEEALEIGAGPVREFMYK